MSSADTAAPGTAPDEAADAPAEPDAPKDDLREGLIEAVTSELGADAVLGTHIRPDDDLWIRVSRESWAATGDIAKRKLGLTFFDFLSGIDWLPSPFGRDMDSQEDTIVHGGKEPKEPTPMVAGYAGGDTRFQVFARVVHPTKFHSITFKVDLPDDDLSVDSWVPNYFGANWHEREAHEMFGFTFNGHPNLIKLYLPGAFEGHPLRKDFPLIARRVKPWPGIVDVEPMPGGDESPDGDNQEGESA